jgi:hypothetical protein
MSRPKGSKNKSTLKLEKSGFFKDLLTAEERAKVLEAGRIIHRGRGRPKKPRIEDKLVIPRDNELLPILFGNVKELKREIRRFKKLKLACRSGTPERIELHRKIKELKKQLEELKKRPQENLTPLTFVKKERPIEPIIEENYPDNNGCNCFGYCKRINNNEIINRTCYNPKYFIEKLERKCEQLILTE